MSDLGRCQQFDAGDEIDDFARLLCGLQERVHAGPVLVPIVFLSGLSMFTIGGVFGASWIRFGARGPQFVGTSGSVRTVGRTR